MSDEVLERRQRLARRHLWAQSTRMDRYDSEPIPVIVKGDGCYVWDDRGNRYLDALSNLFCVNAGHGRTELAEAAARQVGALGYASNWASAHPLVIELAARVAELAPGPLNRVFFTSGGAESVEAALKMARHFHKLTGHPLKTKVIARRLAYHGGSMGALSLTGIPGARAPYEPLLPGIAHVRNANPYRLAPHEPPEVFAEAIRERILFEGPDTVAAVILEPVQNVGGCLTPPPGYFERVRELCDEFDVLLISDEVICSWGRLGTWFGCERLHYVPDIITTAKGLTSAYAPMGAVIAADRIAEAFEENAALFVHGYTFGGHPMACAVALRNLELLEDEDLLGHVRRNEGALRATLERLRDIPIFGEARGLGYFQAIELVRDQATREPFTAEEKAWLVPGFLNPELHRRGLICRADDRGDTVIQFAPPLIAGQDEFDALESVLRPLLVEASERLGVTRQPA